MVLNVGDNVIYSRSLLPGTGETKEKGCIVKEKYNDGTYLIVSKDGKKEWRCKEYEQKPLYANLPCFYEEIKLIRTRKNKEKDGKTIKKK